MNQTPDRLYDMSFCNIVSNFEQHRNALRYSFNISIKFEVFWQFFCKSKCDILILIEEFNNFTVFNEFLSLSNRRAELHYMFQRAVDVEPTLIECLLENFDELLKFTCSSVNVDAIRRHLSDGLGLALFLVDAGWYKDAERVVRSVQTRLQSLLNINSDEEKSDWSHLILSKDKIAGDSEILLLSILTSFCQFPLVDKHYHRILGSIDHLNSSSGHHLNLVSLFTEFSSYCYMRSNYIKAWHWGFRALQEIRKCDNNHYSNAAVICALRQASRACVVRRKYATAEILIEQTIYLALETFGESHLMFANVLMDYASFFLNVDKVNKSVMAYSKALDIRYKYFGYECTNNIHIAISLNELAYATYVMEYDSGNFDQARRDADRSLKIMSTLLHPSHLYLATSQRVLALILEEIGLDLAKTDKDAGYEILLQAEKLHSLALSLSVNTFGENSVQTAKHYGNMGRLYQSLERFDMAEKMHLKAIQIKELLLGAKDFEVSLSIGHLASLYNHDLKEFQKAEVLYLRSLDIGLQLFGPSYTALEYDYRGLICVYQETQNVEKYDEYCNKLYDWQILQQARKIEDQEWIGLRTGTNEKGCALDGVVGQLLADSRPLPLLRMLDMVIERYESECLI